ncbi:hypothetical protein NECAME_04855 [Necator americanus]|uniref:Uncharacterized protein n=1 Tax=Necator americanus TaxID=51031 RepID=W2SPS3_NECAM|nr:hypothetical protein NECAME_04855 [Necator americanus]ETN70697.1 hypothetical protein NECAME_04855 [Necator americanus]
MPASYSSAPISGFTGHIPGAKWQVGSRYVPPTRSHASSHPPSALSSPSSEHLRNGFPLERSPQPTTRPPSVKQRARSLPRRTVEKDPFEGLEGGWWSKGEVQRNKERRDLANSGKTVAGGDWSQRPDTPKRHRQSRWQDTMQKIHN